MGCTDEEGRGMPRMSIPTMMGLITWFLGLLQGEPGETGPPGRVSGAAVGVGYEDTVGLPLSRASPSRVCLDLLELWDFLDLLALPASW